MCRGLRVRPNPFAMAVVPVGGGRRGGPRSPTRGHGHRDGLGTRTVPSPCSRPRRRPRTPGLAPTSARAIPPTQPLAARPLPAAGHPARVSPSPPAHWQCAAGRRARGPDGTGPLALGDAQCCQRELVSRSPDSDGTVTARWHGDRHGAAPSPPGRSGSLSEHFESKVTRRGR